MSALGSSLLVMVTAQRYVFAGSLCTVLCLRWFSMYWVIYSLVPYNLLCIRYLPMSTYTVVGSPCLIFIRWFPKFTIMFSSVRYVHCYVFAGPLCSRLCFRWFPSVCQVYLDRFAGSLHVDVLFMYSVVPKLPYYVRCCLPTPGYYTFIVCTTLNARARPCVGCGPIIATILPPSPP